MSRPADPVAAAAYDNAQLRADLYSLRELGYEDIAAAVECHQLALQAARKSVYALALDTRIVTARMMPS